MIGGGLAGLKRSALRVPGLVAVLPDLEQTDRRVEPVKDGERHRDVRDDGPRARPVKAHHERPEAGVALHQRVDHPGGQVGDQQEGHDLPPRLGAVLAGALAPAPPAAQHEQRLERGLRQRQHLRQHRPVQQLPVRVVRADDGKHAVDVDAGLRHQQQVLSLSLFVSALWFGSFFDQSRPLPVPRQRKPG